MKLKGWPSQTPLPRMSRVALFYGPDQGQVATRAKETAASAVADLSDPFGVCTVSCSDLIGNEVRFWDEVSAQSLMGGDRLLWIKDADDKIAPTIKSYIEQPNPHCYVVLEGGDLSAKSALRAIAEKSDLIATVACYVEEERDLSRQIGKWLQDAGYPAASDALNMLSQNVKGDHAVAKAEVEKLTLYMASAPKGTQIKAADVSAVASDTRAESMDVIMLSIPSGDVAKGVAAWQSLAKEGMSAIAVLRVLQTHFRRLLQARLWHEEQNRPIDMCVDSLLPKPFYKHVDPMKVQVKRWTAQELQAAIDMLVSCEMQCKRSGFVPETLMGWCLMALARKQPSSFTQAA